jgi:hypothetical protein
MPISEGAWAEYLRWNQAVADTFYPETDDARPVYLDVDEEQFPALAVCFGCSETEVEASLAAAVRGVLHRHINEPQVFGTVLRRSQQWYQSWRRTPSTKRAEQAPPPVLALLALLSRAADLMGADARLAANNYYGRLNGLLEINTPKAQERLVGQYREHAEVLWKLLDLWLTGLEGLRGLPSAFAVSHRYVGLPMSQALVRGRDRAKFHVVFNDLGLAAGQQISAEEMERLLDPYLTREDSPLSRALRRLWTREAARERIASVAAVELEAWQGPDRDDAEGSPSGGAGDVRLALLQRSFPVPLLETSIFVRYPGAGSAAELEVMSADAAEKPRVAFAEVSGWLRPVAASGIDVASLLEGVLVMQDGPSRVLRRIPRRVVPLRWDELAGAFLEVERVTLTEDVMILSKVESADAVAKALEQVAREGWSRVDERRGLPEGWVLFTDVQVLAVLPSGGHLDLNVLIPHVRSQVSLAGGMRLPGGLRKFSSLAPPEVRFVMELADEVGLALVRGADWDSDGNDLGDFSRSTVLQETVSGSAGVWPLSGHELADGDYELLVVPRPVGRPQTYQVRLRSGDSVDGVMWSRSPRLVYDLVENPGWGLMSAQDLDDGSEMGVDGATPFGEPPSEVARVQPAAVLWWSDKAASAPRAENKLRLAQPDPTSCVNTGRHRIILPTYYGGRSSAKTIDGKCEGCGLVKRYPTWLPRNGKRPPSSLKKLEVVVADVRPVEPGELTWDVALDAVMHAGGGSVSALERVALQIQQEASSLFVDQFQRTLVLLGHVDVARDVTTFRPDRWEITPSALAGLADGSYQLIGYWPSLYRRELEKAVLDAGGHLVTERQQEAPSRHVVVDQDPSTLESLVGQFDFPVTVTDNSGPEILRRLPPLSVVEPALPRIPLPGGRTSRFDVAAARWVDADSTAAPGAYRLQSFSTWDVIRREDDLRDGTARLATVHLSKHLEALRQGRMLLAYRPAERQLVVPLGCDLPGLLGRGVTLLSGKIPTPVQKQRALVYHDVPAEAAELVAGLLSS